MDTAQWGPDGWKLLHCIAYYYDKGKGKGKDKDNIKPFLRSIGHLLPCIYCRRSYKQYISELHPTNENVMKWMYKIHNKVNSKLKKQGYNDKPDPLFDEIEEKYKRIFKGNKNCTVMGWDFLYSIIFSYDEGISQTRKKAYVTFFNGLANFLPNEVSQTKYKEYIQKNPIEKCIEDGGCLKKWFYSFEKSFKKKCCTYTSRCKKIEKYRVDKCVGNTCRSL